MILVLVFKDGELIFETQRIDYPETGKIISCEGGFSFYKVIGRTIKMDGSIELEVE